MKYSAIYQHKESYPIGTMCAFFQVSRSGYYAFVSRMNRPDRDEPLAKEIAECQRLCRRTYGYRRVHIWLEKKRGIYLNPKTVLRIMNKYGLLSEVRRHRKYRQMGEQIHKYENLLNRNFQAARPNQKWVTDISYIQTGQGTLYLSVIKDLYDNSIVAHKTATAQSINLVLDTIRQAKKKEAVAAEIQLHSDQGSQYTSRAYHNLIKEYGITPSMSRRGNCLDNAPAENFFGILKAECINRLKIQDFQTAKILIDDFIYFYNHQRLQLKTKLTPLEVRHQIA